MPYVVDKHEHEHELEHEHILFWKAEKVLPQHNNMQKSCVSTPIMVIYILVFTVIVAFVEGANRRRACGAKTMPVTSFNWFNVEPQNVNDVDCCVQFGTRDFYVAGLSKARKTRQNQMLLLFAHHQYISLFFACSHSHSHPFSLHIEFWMTSAIHAHTKEQLYTLLSALSILFTYVNNE